MVPSVTVTPAAQPTKRQRHKSSPSELPLPDENASLDAMETSATADDAASLDANKKLNAPNDKRSRKSDDEASDVDSEVQEAARGISGRESEDLLQVVPEEKGASEENPPKESQ